MSEIGQGTVMVGPGVLKAQGSPMKQALPLLHVQFSKILLKLNNKETNDSI